MSRCHNEMRECGILTSVGILLMANSWVAIGESQDLSSNPEAVKSHPSLDNPSSRHK